MEGSWVVKIYIDFDPFNIELYRIVSAKDYSKGNDCLVGKKRKEKKLKGKRSKNKRKRKKKRKEKNVSI